MIQVAALSELRQSELLGLRWSDVDFGHGGAFERHREREQRPCYLSCT
jgi:integrase